MFALQAMIFLEWASRLASSDKTGNALTDLSTELNNIESRYFTQLPSFGGTSNKFKLPFISSQNSKRELLSILFDLIRHGQAHQYQQIQVKLLDN